MAVIEIDQDVVAGAQAIQVSHRIENSTLTPSFPAEAMSHAVDFDGLFSVALGFVYCREQKSNLTPFSRHSKHKELL